MGFRYDDVYFEILIDFVLLILKQEQT